MLEEALTTSLQTSVQIPAIGFSDAKPASDGQLAALVLEGDDAAFAKIFDRHKRLVTRTVGRFFRERADVEEFVQQSFTKAYFSLKSYRGDEDVAFAAWLKRIAVNVCYDEFRRRQRKGESLFTDMSGDETDYVASIIDHNHRLVDFDLQVAQIAERILSSLAPDDRVAMTLVYSQDYSLDEAADAIGITTSNLKSRLFRCRNHIKKRFGHLFT